jgi:hypothetical protein
MHFEAAYAGRSALRKLDVDGGRDQAGNGYAIESDAKGLI